jgi:hypothetical protein
MKVVRDGIEVDVSVRELTTDEKRAYDRAAKQRSREAAREAEKIAQQEPKDTFTLWFESRSPSDRREWLLTHPRLVQLKYESMKTEGVNDAEVRALIAEQYSFTETEVAEMIAGTYKKPSSIGDEQLKPVKPAKPEPMPPSGVRRYPEDDNGTQLCQVHGGIWSHVRVPIGTSDADVRKIAGAGSDGKPVPVVTNAQAKTHAETSLAAQEVKDAISDSPMRKLEECEKLTGVPASWLSSLRGSDEH